MAFIFDKEAPDIFRERINEVRSIFPQIKIFCVEGFDDIDATVNHHVDNHTDIVIAPRIDIDDFLKKDVLDPQGKVVENTLISMGMENLKSIRQGKFFEIEVDENDQKKAEEKVKVMCEKLLVNLIIEDYQITKLI